MKAGLKVGIIYYNEHITEENIEQEYIAREVLKIVDDTERKRILIFYRPAEIKQSELQKELEEISND